MLGRTPKEKFYECSACNVRFSNNNATRVCSNCFACTGCEIYNCPSCGTEVVIKPQKPMKGIGSR